MRRIAIGLAMMLAPATAGAQPGSAKGSYAETRSDAAAKPIRLTYAVALRKDDAAAPDDYAGVWVLLSDRPVEAKALAGGIFPPAIEKAKAGEFEGILFVLGKEAREAVHIRVLSKARNPEGSFESLSLSGTDLWKSLNIGAARVSGAMEREGISFSFDAPVADDPVQQDLKGVAARDSAIGKILIRNINAWIAGDLAGLEATMTKQRFAMLKALPAAERKAILDEAKKSSDMANARKIERVTVRAMSATAKTVAGNYDLVMEDGVWKID